MEDRGNHLCFALKHTDNTSCILSMAIAVKSNFQKGCCHIGEVAKLMGHAKELVTVDIYGDNSIVNDIRNFVFGIAGAAVYGSCKRRKQKFVMSFTIVLRTENPCANISVYFPDCTSPEYST